MAARRKSLQHCKVPETESLLKQHTYEQLMCEDLNLLLIALIPEEMTCGSKSLNLSLQAQEVH